MNCAINEELKRWTILDLATNKLVDLTDNAFNEGIQNNFITLTGKFVTVENNHRLWVDGVVKR